MTLKSTGLPIICDGCGDPIHNHADAYVEWLEPAGGTASGVRIIHHLKGKMCFAYTRNPHRSDLHLTGVLADKTLMKRLGLV
ncbi:TPA: hypothetical protein ACGG77_000872 [Vibrio cholerae]